MLEFSLFKYEIEQNSIQGLVCEIFKIRVSHFTAGRQSETSLFALQSMKVTFSGQIT